jgi:hypothetical protein
MSEDYAISIDLALLPLPLRNKYIAAIKKLNIYYLLEDQVLKISENNAKKLFDEIEKDKK